MPEDTVAAADKISFPHFILLFFPNDKGFFNEKVFTLQTSALTPIHFSNNCINVIFYFVWGSKKFNQAGFHARKH